MLALLSLACLSTDALVPPTVDEDPTLSAIDLGDTRLRAERWGDVDDPLLVLLHGGPGADFDGMLRLAALTGQGFQVLAYDQRGAGLSRRHDPGSVDAALLVDHLLQLIAATSPDGTAVLVGHSWGGQLAAATVQAAPDTISVVVLLDPGPFTGARWEDLGLREIDMTAEHLNDLFWSEQMVSPDGHARLDWHFAQLLSGQLDGYQMSETDPMPFQRMGYVGYSDVLSAAMVDGEATWDFREGLMEWPGSAHFAWGGANRIMDEAYRAAQEGDWPRVTSTTIEGVGHDLPWVAADALLAHLSEVL